MPISYSHTFIDVAEPLNALAIGAQLGVLLSVDAWEGGASVGRLVARELISPHPPARCIYIVTMSVLKPHLRGQGNGREMYAYAARACPGLLMHDTHQTESAVNLWASLARRGLTVLLDSPFHGSTGCVAALSMSGR